jgi:mannose-1-phosphate guanylyltransferase
MLHAVIMAGGTGTRFWPVSRSTSPKQLLNLIGDQSMIQATAARLTGLVPADRQLVVTNQALTKAIAQQLPDLPTGSVVGEPCKRDTAPCVGLAAAIVGHADQDATMLVMPADHVIRATKEFQGAIQEAVGFVEQHPERLVTFGIRPTYAAESFGYIERGARLDAGAGSGDQALYDAHKFHEKPSAEVAQGYVAAGSFYWNSGIFVWKAQTILDALAKFEPDMFNHLERIAETVGQSNFATTLDREFAAIEGKSIDYAIMEKYDKVAVIEARFDWDDLGSWQSLARMRGSDEQDNTIVGQHLGVDTRGCTIRSENDHLIVTLGLKDCIVVHTPDATLVARLADEESIRQVVSLIKQQGWDHYL